jgi:hypothetical protein
VKIKGDRREELKKTKTAKITKDSKSSVETMVIAGIGEASWKNLSTPLAAKIKTMKNHMVKKMIK